MNGLILESLGWALIHLLWQGALVAVLLALALRVLGRKAATARYALACTALVAMLVLPVATAWRHHGAAQARPADVSAPVALVGDGVDGGSRSPARNPHPRPLPEGEGVAPVASVSASSVLERVSFYMPWLVFAWGLGVAFSSLRLLSGWLRLRRQVRLASPAPAEWQARLDALAHRLGLSRAVRLLQSTAIDVPATVGWLSPVVLLPASTLTGLSARQLEMILAHELAHIRRYDFAVNLAQTLVETLLFYHPAVWWISHVIRVEREHCCDDIAAGTSGSSLSYARALTALEALRVLPSLAPSPALSALGGSLPERVRRLVGSPATRCSSRWVAGASALTLVSSLAVAAPLTAFMLPAKELSATVPDAPSSAVASGLPAPSVTVPVPMPVPAPRVPTPVVSPVARPVPTPRPLLAAGPNPNPNPNPSPHPGRRGGEVDHSARVGEGPLSVDQLVTLKNAGVTPELVETVKGMGYEPTVDTLVDFGHARITPEYVKDMNARFGTKLSPEALAEMKHLGVTPAFIEAMKAQGFTTNNPHQLSSARAVGVDEAYLRGLKDAGYTGLDLETVVELRAVGVRPETISALAQAGYPKLPADTLVEFKALGVTPDYIRGLKESGLKDLKSDELVELRALGVDAAFIREMRAAGLETVTADELVRLRASGIDADFIRRMKQPRK